MSKINLKQATLYTVEDLPSIDIDSINSQFASLQAVEPLAFEQTSSGFAFLLETGEYAVNMHSMMIFNYGIYKKSVPASTIKLEMEKHFKKEGKTRKQYKKAELKEIKLHVTENLMAKAMLQYKEVACYIDLDTQVLVIGTKAAKEVEAILYSLGKVFVNSNFSQLILDMGKRLNSIVIDNTTHLEVLDEIALEGMDGEKIRSSGADFKDELMALMGSGCYVKSVAMFYQGTAFTIDLNGDITKLKFDTASIDKQDKQTDDDELATESFLVRDSFRNIETQLNSIKVD